MPSWVEHEKKKKKKIITKNATLFYLLKARQAPAERVLVAMIYTQLAVFINL